MLKPSQTLAFALPPLFAFTQTPSSTLLNQLLAIACWGAVLWLLPAGQAGLRQARGAWPVLLALGVMLLCVAVSWGEALPTSIALSMAAAMVCAATLVVMAQCAPCVEDAAGSLNPIQPMLTGLLLAGVLSALIALVQVFAPSWADGHVIAKSGLAGRAVGNLRQPNHLSTLLLWALIALVPLAQARRVMALRLPAVVAAVLAALMVLGVVLTASRTGVVGMFLLSLWGVLDRRLRPSIRWALVLGPLVYLAGWLGVDAWAHQTQHTFGGEVRLGEADLSSSRFGVWSNAWSLIKMNPWFGVGWGEFNFAWSLTPFPTRPVAFFDHAHNLPIHLAVELGLPVALLLMGLLSWALWLAFRRAAHVPGDAGAGARATAMMVLLVGLHSLLEYPLWYVYFLLPTAWAWGHALRVAPAKSASVPTGHTERAWWPEVAGGLMLVGALYAAWDYQHVTVIYAPGAKALPLDERIARGQESPLFGHHADYAAATSATPPSRAMGAFQNTTHALLDTRLMMAWAKALSESGHVERARYLADRLREFHNPASDDFFAECDAPGAQPKPFQCTPAGPGLSWRDFMH
jgi:O-antigen ligase